MVHPIIINEKQRKILEKAKLNTYEQIIRTRPNKYYNCRNINCIAPQFIDQNTVLIGRLLSIKNHSSSNGRQMTFAKLIDVYTNIPFTITWFNTIAPVKRWQNYVIINSLYMEN